MIKSNVPMSNFMTNIFLHFGVVVGRHFLGEESSAKFNYFGITSHEAM